tara:strand:+ start:816 stop:1289 length:474 start_codon:yes stop_codon:yes gene_type:complete
MKILLLAVGTTTDENMKNQIQSFTTRLSHYVDFKYIEIPNKKKSNKLTISEFKNFESETLEKNILKGDYIILLDEKGKSYTSVEFSKKIEGFMINSYKRIVFVIGGAHGFTNQIYNLANDKLSLSKMTFSHQMIRLFFVEQLYRAFTIIKNEKYHNQ